MYMLKVKNSRTRLPSYGKSLSDCNSIYMFSCIFKPLEPVSI